MNPEGAKISGMIAVCTGRNGDARLSYEIDLAANTVTYILLCNRRDRGGNDPERLTRWNDYAEVKAAYETACDIVQTGTCNRIVHVVK